MRIRFNEDRGVTSAITVLLLTAFLGLIALVVDVTATWQVRRQLITTTDAAALAAAQDYVEGDNGCGPTGAAQDYVARNNATATMTACTPLLPTPSRPGRVTVEAEATVDFIFAPILGFSDTDIASSTTVNYDLANSVHGGLRPFGLCEDVIDALTPPVVPGNGVIYRIVYGKDSQPDACNGGDNVPGNWGIMDFDGGSNPLGDIRDWTEDGYPGEVEIGDIIYGDTGSFANSLDGALTALLAVDSFTLPIFDTATGTGSNAQFHIVDFAAVKLHGFKADGNQAERYLDLEFVNAVVQGGGGGPGDGLGAYVIGICAVDGIDPSSTCE